MPENSSLAKAFADRRVTLRLTQQGLADLAGVSRYSIQSLERGDGSTKLSSVLQIAEALGLHLDVSTTAE
jgi:DNA-binding XRE family transcriptional regulator